MRSALALAATLLLAGCGGNFQIIAPTVREPVAASNVLFGPDLQPLRVPEELEVVGHFTRSERQWNMFWNILPLTPRAHDLSDYFSEQIRLNNGEAITGLTVTAHTTILSNMLGIVPLIPTVVRAEVSGDVVRRRSAGAP
ncbi:MAG: hypothetical protein SF182_13770 [Deltaproteobacteria bacterium]|nr:hypothetical protein [Deltaproteobacteria bacterium]